MNSTMIETSPSEIIVTKLNNDKKMYRELMQVIQNTFLVYPQESDVLKMVEDTYRAYPQKWELIRSIENSFDTYPNDPRMIVTTLLSNIRHKKMKNISYLESRIVQCAPNMNKIIKKLTDENPEVEMTEIFKMANTKSKTELITYKKQVIQHVDGMFGKNFDSPSEMIKNDLLMYFDGLALPFDVKEETFQYVPKESDDWLQTNPDLNIITNMVKATFEANPDQMKLIQMTIMEHMGTQDLDEVSSMIEEVFKTEGANYYGTKGMLTFKLLCMIDRANQLLGIADM